MRWVWLLSLLLPDYFPKSWQAQLAGSWFWHLLPLLYNVGRVYFSPVPTLGLSSSHILYLEKPKQMIAKRDLVKIFKTLTFKEFCPVPTLGLDLASST